MADYKKELEERLREFCCNGDIKNVQLLVERGVSINAQNAMNGWTPLHWAAKRGRVRIVKYLLQEGVVTTALTKKGETAAQLSSDESVRKMLGEEDSVAVNANDEALPIVPNYLRNPEFFYAQKTSSDETTEKWRRRGKDDSDTASHEACVINMGNGNRTTTSNSSSSAAQTGEEIVLKLRIADSGETDFIEVDCDRSNLTFRNLQAVCCEELGIEATNIKKIRKLPNTIVRNDKDVTRLLPYQELEVVLTNTQRS